MYLGKLLAFLSTKTFSEQQLAERRKTNPCDIHAFMGADIFDRIKPLTSMSLSFI